MRSGSELADIRKIQILSDQETAVQLGPFPDDLIGFAIDPLILGRVGFVAKSRKDRHQCGGQVLYAALPREKHPSGLASPATTQPTLASFRPA